MPEFARVSRRLLRFISLALFGLGLFLSAELFLRIYYKEQLRLQAYPLIYQPDLDLGYRYLPKTKGRICIPSICKEFEINERGYYGRPFSVQKPEGTCRIAIMGSSLANGIWMGGHEDFAMVMGRWFEERSLPVEVLNLSIDGRFRDLQITRHLESSEIGSYNLDLALLWVEIPFLFAEVRRENYRGYVLIYRGGDENSLQEARQQVDRVLEHRLLASLYELSYSVRAAARLYLRHGEPGLMAQQLNTFVRKRYQSPELLIYPLSVRKSEAALRHATETARSRGTLPVLMSFWRDEELRKTAEVLGVPIIELALDGLAIGHEHDGHFNEDSHQLIADRLIETLRRLGYLTPEGRCTLSDPPFEGPPVDLQHEAEPSGPRL